MGSLAHHRQTPFQPARALVSYTSSTHPDLVADQHLSAGAFPAARARRRDHEARRRIDVQLRDDACPRRSGNDEEGHRRVLERGLVLEVVEAEDIMGCARGKETLATCLDKSSRRAKGL